MKENERIKTVREVLKFTQQEFADRLGVSKQYLSKVENGGTDLSKDRIMMISQMFGISTDWLLFERGGLFIHENEKLDELFNTTDGITGVITYLSFFSCYIKAADNIIRAKYPNAIIEDILEGAIRVLIKDLLHKKYIPSNVPPKLEFIQELINDNEFNKNIISAYCENYVNRCELKISDKK
jgi:transcriptional regulator with XRE-family HTH domain